MILAFWHSDILTLAHSLVSDERNVDEAMKPTSVRIWLVYLLLQGAYAVMQLSKDQASYASIVSVYSCWPG